MKEEVDKKVEKEGQEWEQQRLTYQIQRLPRLLGKDGG